MTTRLRNFLPATSMTWAIAIAAGSTPAHATGECLSFSFGPTFQQGFYLLIYDADRNVTVAVDGVEGETLELVNNEWVPKGMLNGLFFDNLHHAAGAFRSATGQSVILTLDMGLWAWNGQQWTQLAPAGVPSDRGNFALTYDPYRDVLIVFGGTILPAIHNPTNETWEYDFAAGTWALIASPNAPSARARASMAFDADRNVAVLFGGRGTNNEMLGDTWEYDPVTGQWSEYTTEVYTTPPPRQWAGMVWHSGLARIMISGGLDGNQPYTDVWVFDGHRWIQRHPSGLHPTSQRFFMTYDAASNVTRQWTNWFPTYNHLIIEAEAAAPIIVQQPQNQVVTAGQPVQFSVEALGNPEHALLDYQWRHNGQPIPGANLSAYTIASVTESHMGAYDCVVTHAGFGDLHCGKAVSIAATLTVEPGTCFGDLTGDGNVGVSDLLMLLGAWGPCP